MLSRQEIDHEKSKNLSGSEPLLITTRTPPQQPTTCTVHKLQQQSGTLEFRATTKRRKGE
jgi:hypothetical protein